MTKDRSKLVWITDPKAAKRLRDQTKLETGKDADPAGQTIRVTVDRKRRAGKPLLSLRDSSTPRSRFLPWPHR